MKLWEWITERLDLGIKRFTDVSSPEGYVFYVDRSHGNDEWMITAKPKHGFKEEDLPIRHFVVEVREMK